MKSKLSVAIVLMFVISLVPALVSARAAASTSPEKAAKVQDLKNLKTEQKEVKKEIKQTISKQMVTRYAAAYAQIVKMKIRTLENAISRLMNGPQSIIAKLDANGKNTTTIKAKLSEAKDILTKAKADLVSANTLTQTTTATSTGASTTPNLNKVKQVKAAFQSITNEITTANKKVNEAIKMIKEVRGIVQINSSTSPATTTTATSTN